MRKEGDVPAHRWLSTGFELAALVVFSTVAAVLGSASPAAARLSDAVPAEYRGFMEQAVEDCPGLPAEVLAAQLQQESDFNPTAVSPAGAMGIAQFMPGTWAEWGRDANGNGTASPFDPADAIYAQGRFMCDLLRRRNCQDLWIGVSRDLLTTSDLVG